MTLCFFQLAGRPGQPSWPDKKNKIVKVSKTVANVAILEACKAVTRIPIAGAARVTLVETFV